MSEHRERSRQVRMSLAFRQFQLPPVGDGLLVGRRASIGPTAIFESMERLLPGLYELVAVDHQTVEAVIVLKSRMRMLGKEKLVQLVVDNGVGLMDDTSCLQLTIDGEVTVSMEIDR